MKERLSKCPACETPILTPADAAAHVCPSNPTNPSSEEVDLAELASKEALKERKKIKPTKDMLLKDSITACQQLSEFWDGEVDMIVVMIPKDTLNVAYCTSISHAERLRAVFQKLLQDTTRLGALKEGVKS